MRKINRAHARAGLLTVATTCAVGLAQLVGAAPASAAVVANGAFVHHHVTSGLNCGAEEVMVGVHLAQNKVICAALNFDYKVGTRITDPVHGTQVSSNPVMHGCPPDFLIQGMKDFGGAEELTCVSLRNNQGQALTLTRGVHDGRGPNDNGTQSTIYGLTPTMHVCGTDLAMRGIHQSQNDLFCAG